jgi:hypothetical protein
MVEQETRQKPPDGDLSKEKVTFVILEAERKRPITIYGSGRHRLPAALYNIPTRAS